MAGRGGLAGCLLAGAVLMLVGCSGVTCDETAARSARVSAEDLRTVRVVAGAGSLDIEGQAAASEIRATGTACAPTRGRLEEVRFEVTRGGTEVLIEALTPGGNTRLDVVIELPDWVAVDIEDGSGSIEVGRVSEVQMDDGSGSARIDDVAGDVRVADDGSGDLEIGVVAGNVEIEEDGSGDLEIRDVAGSIEIGEDGSGDITVSDVGGDVRIFRDGSGSITARNITGNLQIDQAGSGGITYSNVRGTVDVPDD